nr:MAG TPA: hypothetical protein [Caudoviricetes sp.]
MAKIIPLFYNFFKLFCIFYVFMYTKYIYKVMYFR